MLYPLKNFAGDVGLADRFEEYPKLRELIRLKNELIDETAHPPMYLKCDLDTFELKSLEQKFDVILIEPPLEEYARSYGVTNVKFWDWDKIMVKHLELSIYKVDSGDSRLFSNKILKNYATHSFNLFKVKLSSGKGHCWIGK